MNEIWKPIKNWEDLYEISNTGFVRSKKRIGSKGGLLRRRLNKLGYDKACLHRSQQISVHRLVAQAFIPNPKNKPCINHKDNNPSNNSVENLEWCTYSENSQHRKKTGRQSSRKGENNGNAKLNWNIVKNIRHDYFDNCLKKVDLARKHNISKSTISSIISQETWKE